jgi:hypothetical protein
MRSTSHNGTEIKKYHRVAKSPFAKNDDSWRIWVPALLLIVVALCQMVLAKTTLLSPWKGGGFGMFSTIDGTTTRYFRVFVEAKDRSEELPIARSQEFAAGRAQLFPSDALLIAFARAIAARERRYNRPVTHVRLELWRAEYPPGSTSAKTRRLRTFTWNVLEERHN